MSIYDDVAALQEDMTAAQTAITTMQTTIETMQAAVTAATAATTDSGWNNLILSDGWDQDDYSTDKPQYRKIGKTVKLRGLVNANSSAGIVIGTLPEGYRPADNFFTRSTTPLNQTDKVNIEIKPDGKVQDYAKAAGQTRTFICLNGVEFTID